MNELIKKEESKRRQKDGRGDRGGATTNKPE
jgi:hypothetical protein